MAITHAATVATIDLTDWNAQHTIESVPITPKLINYYIAPVVSANVSSGAPPGANDLAVMPAHLPAGTIDRMGVWITSGGTAGSVVRLGIYAPSASTGLPGALLGSTSTIDTTGTGFKEATVSITLTSGGLVYLAAVAQVAAPQWVYFNSLQNHLVGQTTPTTDVIYGYLQSSVSGALPDPTTATGIQAGAGSTPRVWVRYSA